MLSSLTIGQVEPNKSGYENNAAPAQEEQKLEEKESAVPTRNVESVNKKAKSADANDYKKDASVNQQQVIGSNKTQFATYKTKSATMRTQRTPSEEQQQMMDKAVKNLESTAPESFEYNYFKYVAGNYNTELIPYLLNAEKLRPNNSDVQIQLAAYYIITNNNAQTKKYLGKLVQSGRINKASLDYARDLIVSPAQNATLIVHGFDDNYAVQYLQSNEGLRKDLTIVSLDFLQSEQYRANLRKNGFKLPDDKTINTAYLDKFCKVNTSKKINISLTTPKEYFSSLSKNLYVVGLTFEYHDKAFNNFYQNEILWSHDFSKLVIDHGTSDRAKELSSNYLPMLFQLRKVYKEKAEMDKIGEIDEAIDRIGAQSNKYDKVQKLKNAY